MKLKNWLVALLVLLVLGSVVYMLREPILTRIGSYLILQDELRPVDVIHVIAGDDYRTLYAIQLYQQGYAQKIFFTGGMCKYHGYLHGEHGLQLAVANGVPAEAIAFDESPVMSTYDEALLLQKYLQQHFPNQPSVIVVSDPFHMRRSAWTYHHILGKTASVLMAPVPFEQTPYQKVWWQHLPSRQYVFDEYKKMLYYFLRYQLSQDWLAVLDRE